MKVRYLFALLFASLSTKAVAQDLAAPKCPSGPPLSATIAQDACQQAFDVYQFMAPQLGLALTGGIATAGQGGVLGGLGHLSVGLRVNGFHGKIPDVNNPAFATAVGLVMYAHRNHVGEVARPVGAGAFGRVAGRLRGLFKEFF